LALRRQRGASQDPCDLVVWSGRVRVRGVRLASRGRLRGGTSTDATGRNHIHHERGSGRGRFGLARMKARPGSPPPRLRVRCCSPRPLRRAPREPLAGPPARDATALPAPAPAPALAPQDSTHRRLRGMRMFGEPRATRSQLSTPQFIYVMKDLRKVVPPSREVLKGIWLSFYPGAKIGVVGPNGSGKSTLLRIMAGVDTDFQGEAWAAKGTRIGYLPQEPQLDPNLDVRGNVEQAVAYARGLLRRFDEVNAKFAEPMSDDEMTALLDEQAKIQ